MRPERAKRIARDLIYRFPSRFTDGFNSNKKAVKALTNISSRKSRNRITGYVAHVISITQSSEEGSRGAGQSRKEGAFRVV